MESTEGLRERKKRLTREQLAATAAQMFMDRGFDGVRVAEVAAACGVSEKTVFNYFPTKEALLLDRLESTAVALRDLGRVDLPPVQAAERLLRAELAATMAGLRRSGDPATAVAAYVRFGDLIRTTPSLRAHRSEMTDRLVTIAAQALAARTGADPGDPEPTAAAAALLGLWRVQYESLRRHLHPQRPPAEIEAAVTADVRRAARLVDAGLAAYPSAHPSAHPSAPAG